MDAWCPRPWRPRWAWRSRPAVRRWTRCSTTCASGLAAGWAHALGVEGILERLEDRFRLLVRSARTVPPRQQTLAAAIDWSYDLLSEPERDLFRRLSVFAGPFGLAEVEAICLEP